MDATLLPFFLFETLPSMLRFIVGIWLFSAPLPFRETGMRRRWLVLALLYLFYVLVSLLPAWAASSESSLVFSIAQFITYSAMLLAFVLALWLVYDCSILTSLFCCSAGYTIQNLASGAVELVWAILGGGDALSLDYHSTRFYIISVVVTVLIYLLCYLLVARNLRRSGLMSIQDRSSVVMMVSTILVIIGFDLVVKWLTSSGIPLLAVVLLRIFHGLACAHVLLIEFQILITRRVEAERDVVERVLAERGRQYSQARENVEAINARVHDIRHALARLADKGGVERELLRNMVQEVAVYDAQSNSGNEALDTALSEKRLMYAGRDIVLTCVADGSALAFMAAADIYVLFCSLLDGIADTGASSVSLMVRETMGTASVHIESNGSLPGASALETVRAIVERNKGTLSMVGQDGSCRIDALFPAR